MNKFKKKRFIIKYILILIIITLKLNRLTNNSRNFFYCDFFLTNLFLIKFKDPFHFSNKKFTNYLYDKNFFLYKICFYYLTLKNLLENPKILIRKKLYSYNKKNKKIKFFFWKFKFLKKFKLNFFRLQIIKKVNFINYVNRYFSNLFTYNALNFFFIFNKEIYIQERKKNLKINKINLYKIKKKNKKISKNFWVKIKKKTLFYKNKFNNTIKTQYFNKFLLLQKFLDTNINFNFAINSFNLNKWLYFSNVYSLTNLKNIYTLPYNIRVTLYDLIKKKR